MLRYCFVTAIPMVLGPLCGTAPGAGEAKSGKHEAAALAKAVAPFVDETTLAVFYGDMSRLEADPFVSLAFELLPGFRSESREAKAKYIADVEAILAALARQGCNDVYVVVNLRLSEYPVMLMVPLPEGVDEAVVDALVEKGRWLEAARLDGAFFAGDPRARSRLEEHRPAPRPDLVAAFEAVGHAEGQMIILPPKQIVHVVAELMSMLPESPEMPSAELIRSIKWEAYGLNMSPEKSLAMVVQTTDARAAVALHRHWMRVNRIWGQNADVRAVLPNCDEVVSLFTPRIDGDRLVVSIDKPDQVDILMDALEKLVRGLDQWLTPSGGAGVASPKGADN